MTTRVTVIIHTAHVTPVNHVKAMLGMTRRVDIDRPASWTDGTNLYAVSSGYWTETQIAGVQNPLIIDLLERAGRIPENVDVAFARQAQSVFVFIAEGDPIPQAVPGKIIAIAGPNPLAILAAAGVQQVETGL